MSADRGTRQNVFFKSTLIAPAVLFVYDRLIEVMPSRLIEKTAKRRGSGAPDWWIEVYMVAATAALAALFVVIGRPLSPPGFRTTVEVLAVALGCLRWAEILVAVAELLVGRGRPAAEATVAVLVVYVPQVVLLFAVAAEVLAPSGFRLGVHGPPPHGVLAFLYVSWTNLTTLGNDFSPVTGAARSIVMVEGATGVLLLGVFLAYAMGRFSGEAPSTPTHRKS
jgi:hypothetical protein